MRWFYAALIVIFFGPLSFAQELRGPPVPPPPPPPEQMGPPIPSDVDDVKEEVAHKIYFLANQLDSFFGEKRSDDEKNGSTLRLIPSYKIDSFVSPQTSMEVRLNLKMLNLEQHGKDLEEAILRPARRWTEGPPAPPGKPGQGGTVETTGSSDEDKLEDQYIGALTDSDRAYFEEQRKYKEQWGWNHSTETRIIVKNPPAAVALYRVRKNFKDLGFVHRFYNEFGWASDTLWSETANFSSDEELSEKTLLRYFNEFDWNLSSGLKTTTHGPSIIHKFNARESISYDFRFTGVIDDIGWTLDNYGPSVNYRRQFQKKWIFMNLNPAVNWGRTYGFETDLSFFISFEFVIGDA